MALHNTQKILIGNLTSCDHSPVQEIALGIEEEGCFCSEYTMTDPYDIRYSGIRVTVAISDKVGTIYTGDVKPYQVLYSSQQPDVDSCRLLGKNAARYAKGLKLIW